jgi:hypothetical protein
VLPSNKLYALTTFFTLLCLGLFLHDFLTLGTHPVGNNMVVVYLTLLSAYAADKEVGRWTKAKRHELAQKKGSNFVVIWALFYALGTWPSTSKPPIKPPNAWPKSSSALSVSSSAAASPNAITTC